MFYEKYEYIFSDISKYVSKNSFFHYDYLFNMHTYKQTLCVETRGDVLLRSALFSAAETGHLTPTHFKLISSSIKNYLCCANLPQAIIHFC